MKNIAVIPARGGSKRLPMKNMIPFRGKPIIRYTIHAALASNLFERIIVSTENAQIADCVKDLSCEVMGREADLASDTARVVDVIKDVLHRLEAGGDSFDNLCCLYATAPMRDSEDIRQSYELLRIKKADFCLAVTEFNKSPFFAFDIDADHFITRRWEALSKLPSWEKPKVVVDNGSMYWATVDAFKKHGELYGDNTVAYFMERWRSVDIDTLTDLKLAEFFSKEFACEPGK